MLTDPLMSATNGSSPMNDLDALLDGVGGLVALDSILEASVSSDILTKAFAAGSKGEGDLARLLADSETQL